VTAPASTTGTPDRALRRVVAQFGSLRWWVLAASLISAATFGAGIGLIAMSGYLISRSALVDTTATLTLAIVGVRFFAVVRAVGRYLERYIGHLGTFRILTRLRVWFFQGIEPLAPAALVDDRAGDVLARIVDDVEALQDLPLRVVAPAIAAVLAGTVGTGVLWTLDPSLAVVLVAFLLVAGVVVPAATRRLERAATDIVTAERAHLNAVSVESVNALADLVAYGREDLFGGRLDELTARRRRAERRLARARGASTALAGLLAGLAAVATLALAIPLVRDGRLESVLLAVVPLATIATFEAVAPLANGYEHLDRCRGAARRLVHLLDRSPTVLDPPARAAGSLCGAGSVEFDHVHFRYVPGEPEALCDATFVVAAGAQVAIVGPSGSGKSTIAALLLRFWEQQRGSIRIDGVDVRDIPADESRAAVAVVAQHDHLFDTTVRDNLLLGDGDATDERLWSVLDAVALGDLVRSLPGGLDERAGEDGRRLSGGERQRLMIARALLAESSVLVLDEATAHLDPETERRVLDGVAAWRRGRTTLHIAHHADALGTPDLVLRVDGGLVTPVER
jgi:ATP-binding cassette subfamily C protein CydC